MNKLMKKRQLVLSALIVALAAAVFANWYYSKPKTTPVSGRESVTQTDERDGSAQSVGSPAVGADTAEYFSSVRLQRDTARDAALQNVKDVMANIDAIDAGTISEADVSLGKITENIKLESDIEALVSAKLGADCVAVINGDAIQVVVPKALIDNTTVLQISDIVLDNTDIKSDNIKIIGA
ncbi:MAG: SpoIIIAH-like family protein [Clostridia bacterium]|nr:SpoIIIAH-like family protein [Clostridia bacterium]